MEDTTVTLDGKIEALNKLANLFIKIKSDPTDYIRKDGVVQHIEWAMSHIAESIWQEAINY